MLLHEDLTKAVSKEELMRIIIRGRQEGFVKRSADYNPYIKSTTYDWDFKSHMGKYLYSDSYRGYNPYSGAEHITNSDNVIPTWYCDYVGYVNNDDGISPEDVYNFLKDARANHYKNCDWNLITDYKYIKGSFLYETIFRGDMNSLLQFENIYNDGKLVAHQVSAGGIK